MAPWRPSCSWKPEWLWYQYVPLCRTVNRYVNVSPGWMPWKLRPGTPSMFAGSRMPCQWIDVSSVERVRHADRDGVALLPPERRARHRSIDRDRAPRGARDVDRRLADAQVEFRAREHGRRHARQALAPTSGSGHRPLPRHRATHEHSLHDSTTMKRTPRPPGSEDTSIATSRVRRARGIRSERKGAKVRRCGGAKVRRCGRCEGAAGAKGAQGAERARGGCEVQGARGRQTRRGARPVRSRRVDLAALVLLVRARHVRAGRVAVRGAVRLRRLDAGLRRRPPAGRTSASHQARAGAARPNTITLSRRISRFMNLIAV